MEAKYSTGYLSIYKEYWSFPILNLRQMIYRNKDKTKDGDLVFYVPFKVI